MPGVTAAMVPLSWEAAETIFSWEDGSRRTLALHHALMHRRPGLWGDHSRRPSSVVLLRRGANQWEAFGAGDPEPAVSWLARRRAPVALLAPDWWSDTVRGVAGSVRRTALHVRFLPEPEGTPILPKRTGPPIETRRLTLADAAAFTAVAPSWTLANWASAEECLGRGAAVGVSRGPSFLALAWIIELDRHLDGIGVYTEPRYRRLGLGWAVSATLVQHIITRRKKCPLWAVAADNEASLALAGALGFDLDMSESVLHFGRGRLEDDPDPSLPGL